MKSLFFPLLVLIALSISGCKKKDAGSSFKSHAILTNIYVDSVGKSSPVVGYKVHFNSDAMGAVSYRWNFGDSNTSADGSPDHVYQKGGTYAVKLTLDENDLVTATTSVYVAEVPTVTATLTGVRTWRCTIKLYAPGSDTTYPTQILDKEIKYIDPVTISFNSITMYFMSSVTSGVASVIKFGANWTDHNRNSSYELTITRTVSLDSFHYYANESITGGYYLSEYISP